VRKKSVAALESVFARGINSLLHEPVSTPQDSSPDRVVSSLDLPSLIFFSSPSIYLLAR